MTTTRCQSPLQIVWFKRDLRCSDNAALTAAATRGPILPVFITEPELWKLADHAARQWKFVAEALAGLRRDLAAMGQPLLVLSGDAESAFTALLERYQVQGVWSHEETGNDWTYRRDRRLRAFLRDRNVVWHELPQNGVVRGLASRDGWSGQWEDRMRRPVHKAPDALPPIETCAIGQVPSAEQLGISADPCPQRQLGGRSAGLEVFRGFLDERGAGYNKELSSPLTAFRSCSRLSPHLAWGTLSIREVVQATRQRRNEVRLLPPGQRGGWPRSLSAFEGRLHWHCHFIQKLESEPRIEYENMQRACDGLREPFFDRERFEAWCAGITGLPLVDACMRALASSGWINFRMRAMLMSFSSYHLWLHWREPALFLARRFTDYEPGIHYSQVQMQSGTTGINTLRIYNPVKQSQDQDPEGSFIRRWVPELEMVPTEWIHTPWRMPSRLQHQLGCRIGSRYPAPIVDHEQAARDARAKMSALRRSHAAKIESPRVLARHGSRRRPQTPRRKKRKAD